MDADPVLNISSFLFEQMKNVQKNLFLLIKLNEPFRDWKVVIRLIANNSNLWFESKNYLF